jgi:hypothetical protein
MTVWVQLSLIAVTPMLIVLYLFVVKRLTGGKHSSLPW